MQEFGVAAGTVIPLFLIIALGYGLKAFKVVDKNFSSVGNKLCFNLFIPLLLFYNIYSTDLKSLFNAKLIIFVAVALAIIFVALWILVVSFEKDNRKRGVLIQGMMRSNFVVLGLPIVISLYGESSAGLVGLLLAVVLPMYNVLSVLALEYFAFKQEDILLTEEDELLHSDNESFDKDDFSENDILQQMTPKKAHNKLDMWKRIVFQVITNPLILASLVAYIFVLCQITVPQILMKPIVYIADATTGFSLLILGTSFQIFSVKENWKELSWAVATRLMIIPAIALTAAVLFGFRGIELAVLISIFGSPTSVSSFAMTTIIGGDDDLSANIIVFSSFFSMFTLFVIIYILEAMNFLT